MDYNKDGLLEYSKDCPENLKRTCMSTLLCGGKINE